jgi:hypothetical protein
VATAMRLIFQNLYFFSRVNDSSILCNDVVSIPHYFRRVTNVIRIEAEKVNVSSFMRRSPSRSPVREDTPGLEVGSG